MSQTTIDDYQPLTYITEKHKQFSIHQWRWIIENKERYNLSKAIKRVGRRLYIHMPSLEAWIESQDA